MKLKLILLCLICQKMWGQSFTLNGTIVGKDSGTVILQYKDANNKSCYDTTLLKQGKFKFQGKVAGTDRAFLNTDTRIDAYDKYQRYLFIEPSVTSIVFDYGNIGKAEITGSKTQKESDAFNNYKIKKINQVKRIASRIDSIRTLLKNGTVDPEVAGKSIRELTKKSAFYWQKMTSDDVRYVAAHTNSHLSLSLLIFLVSRISEDSIEMLYDRLSNKVKTSSLGYRFSEYYTKYKKAIGEEYLFDKISIDESAPAFTLYNSKTDSLTLGAFKGSVVLLEFWELTCLPCLQGNPVIEKLRKQYSEKEFKVIAINSAAAGELPQLISYIEKNKLSQWIHASINSQFKEVNKLILNGNFNEYHGLGVPRTVLIDKSGKVVYKKFGYSPEDMQKLGLLVDKAVNEK